MVITHDRGGAAEAHPSIGAAVEQLPPHAVIASLELTLAAVSVRAGTSITSVRIYCANPTAVTGKTRRKLDTLFAQLREEVRLRGDRTIAGADASEATSR